MSTFFGLANFNYIKKHPPGIFDNVDPISRKMMPFDWYFFKTQVIFSCNYEELNIKSAGKSASLMSMVRVVDKKSIKEQTSFLIK